MEEKKEILKFRITVDEETDSGSSRKNFDLVNQDSLSGVIVEFIEYISSNFPKEFMQAISSLRRIQRNRKKSG